MHWHLPLSVIVDEGGHDNHYLRRSVRRAVEDFLEEVDRLHEVDLRGEQ